MKKPRKPMESPSIRCYEQRVRKNLLNNLLVLFAFLLGGVSKPVSAGTSAFLIYDAGVDILREAVGLEQVGARVRQRVPPQILVVDLPDSLKANQISGARSVYTTPISLTTLEAYGPLAIAAGIQWNRNALRNPKTSGQSVGAIRTLVSQKSLPATPPPTLAADGIAGLRLSWETLEGAPLYEIELALDAGFAQKYCVTRSHRPAAELPLPEGNGMKTVYARVRGVDSIEIEEGTREDVFGAWSHAASLTVAATPAGNSATVPLLTSPLADFVSEGFTLILEWTTGTSQQVRVQVARSDNFQSPLYDALLSGNEYVVPSPGLSVGDTLYWRVKAWGTQKSDWSQVRSLRIGAPHNTHTDVFVNPEAPQ